MIDIQEIAIDEIAPFWAEHLKYLIDDGLITDEEDTAYFQSEEYRGTLAAHMQRAQDTHHLAYFAEDGKRIGAVSYCTYLSEDGKCFILDFWLFPPYRGKGAGHRCFNALLKMTAKEGARYYEINCDGRADRLRFWASNGFVENGVDEYDMKLYIRR